ncbi:retrovirus-related pol polyprotein from transposon TNT 1-94 [Tanacetum coccineum]
MVSLEKNQTWSLVRFPGGKKASQSKWVFRVKEEQDGKKRYKARLVVKGFQPKQGVDYHEIFSQVVKMTTIRLVLSIVATENLYLEQLDVKTTFLHDDLDEYIYMTQPEGFQSVGKEENLVYKLKKSLYRLKQAPRQWYLKFDSFIQRTEYKRCAMDHCLAKQILGMSIIRDRTKGTLRLSYEKYIGKVLEKFNMKDAKARSVGGVMYSMGALRSCQVAAMLLERFGQEYYKYVFIVGGTTVSWMPRIQKCVAMSTTEAEYMAIAEAGKELSAIHLAKNPVFHGRTKHIKIRYHYIRELVSERTLSLKKILEAKNPADMLTKVVTTEKLKLYAASTGIRDN